VVPERFIGGYAGALVELTVPRDDFDPGHRGHIHRLSEGPQHLFHVADRCKPETSMETMGVLDPIPLVGPYVPGEGRVTFGQGECPDVHDVKVLHSHHL